MGAARAPLRIQLDAACGEEPDRNGVRVRSGFVDRNGFGQKLGEKRRNWQSLGQTTSFFSGSHFFSPKPATLVRGTNKCYTYRMLGVRLTHFGRFYAAKCAFHSNSRLRPNGLFQRNSLTPTWWMTVCVKFFCFLLSTATDSLAPESNCCCSMRTLTALFPAEFSCQGSH